MNVCWLKSCVDSIISGIREIKFIYFNELLCCSRLLRASSCSNIFLKRFLHLLLKLYVDCVVIKIIKLRYRWVDNTCLVLLSTVSSIPESGWSPSNES